MADTERAYRCEECGATFDHGVEGEQHHRTMLFRYTCETCYHAFGAEEEFEAHNFKMHSELQKFPR